MKCCFRKEDELTRSGFWSRMPEQLMMMRRRHSFSSSTTTRGSNSTCTGFWDESWFDTTPCLLMAGRLLTPIMPKHSPQQIFGSSHLVFLVLWRGGNFYDVSKQRIQESKHYYTCMVAAYYHNSQ
jgi:hypothetical protein